MKQLFKSLIGAIILLQLIVSCNKNNDGTSAADPTIKIPPPTVYITVTFAPLERPFMNGNFICNATSNGKLTYNGSSEVNNPITFTNVTTPISFRLHAVVTDMITGLSSSKTLDVRSDPYSTDTTYRCANATLDGCAPWTNTSTLQSLNGGVTWTPGPIDPMQWIYYPTGERKAVSGGTSHYQVTYVGSDTFINLGDVGTSNLYKQESLSATTMVLSKTDASGTMFRITYSK